MTILPLAVQPYVEYRTKDELNAWCREANGQYEKDIQALIARIGSHQPKNLERVVYDHEGNEIGIETASGIYTDSKQDHNVPFDSLHLSCEDDFSQESQINPRTKMNVLVPPSDLQGVKKIRPGVYEFSWDDSDDDTIQESQETPDPDTIMDIKVPPPVQQDIEQKIWCPTAWNIDVAFGVMMKMRLKKKSLRRSLKPRLKMNALKRD
ncbi:hypothetical protein L1987_46203 [Smallanthus sonchifolius]|uniref:Uncharacterized protein n=1 Tax=Smallanthus sonchifolius TaxID=185202 RepID=A0ACB9FZM6_9ASTR|nr:hypothetical protein L1987_46203 [Smallanthus sonchifolius]